MDNRIFDVNGRTKEQLQAAVHLLLMTEYKDKQKVVGWYYNQDKGLVLTWHLSPKATAFTDRMGQPSEIEEDELVDLLWDWLKTEEADNVKLGDWEENFDHDGSNDTGWRLYTEEWGHVREGEHAIDHYSIGAFKKVYLWYGK